jgi:hypothetical protein
MTELDPEEIALVEYEKQNELVDPALIPLDIKKLLHKYYGVTLPDFTNKQMNDVIEMLAVPGKMARRATAIVCIGEGTENIDACPYAHTCPLVAAGKPPLGSVCPFEDAMIDSYLSSYMTELEVRAENIIEMAQLKDVITIDLLLQRSTGVLADNGLADENVVAVLQKPGQEASVLYRKDLSHALMAMDKLLMRKERILKSLRATRESRAGDMTKALDPATIMAQIRNKIEGGDIEDAE